ncbi:MAG TPA: SDR family NAD(P)-dependent oxidoreductase [Acidimicrobiia bacterium]|nr:SDR family NAD(P)-dependent oxidoreductase [Acidimicrobiia bacterium]
MAHLVITGASAGIGRAAVVGLATAFSHITIIGRDRSRHAPVLADLQTRGVRAALVECDLGSLGQVAAVVSALTTADPVDVLIANAGVGGQRGITDDGFEIHFGINHLAHHLLVTELADRITDRVVVVSSNAHHDSKGLDLAKVQRRTPSLTGFREYRDSKLANVLAGREMSRRFGFKTHIVHPGMTATDIWRRIPWPVRPLLTRRMATSEEGADTPMWAATAAGLESGGYYARRTLQSPSSDALDEDAARQLWEKSDAWVESHRRVR